MSRLDDLTGRTFGRWTVIELHFKGTNKITKWLCQCSCGKVKPVASSTLKNGESNSCGCQRIENWALAPSEASFNGLYDRYRSGAKTRGYPFELSKDVFREFTKKNCFYCGVEPFKEYLKPRCNGPYIYNGIDRLDNTKGYMIDNIVPCCEVCNQAKHFYSAEDFEKWIDRIVDFRMKRYPLKYIRHPKEVEHGE